MNNLTDILIWGGCFMSLLILFLVITIAFWKGAQVTDILTGHNNEQPPLTPFS